MTIIQEKQTGKIYMCICTQESSLYDKEKRKNPVRNSKRTDNMLSRKKQQIYFKKCQEK